MIHKNCEIRTVRRAGALDRFGQPLYETVYTKFFGRLDESTRVLRTGNGEEITIHGMLILDPLYEISGGDLITIEGRRSDEFKVFDVRESRDIVGNIHHRDLRLVKQIEILP